MKKTILSLLSIMMLSCQGQTNTAYQMKISEAENIKNNNKNNGAIFSPNDDKNMIEIKQKDYNLYTGSSNCQFEILVDDVPPFVGFWGKATEKGTGFAGAIPINSCLLKSGTHSITVKIYPRYGKSQLEYMSAFYFDAYYRKVHTLDEEFEVQLYRLESPTKSGGATGLQGFPYFEMKSEIVADLPFEIEGWRNSVNLKEEQENGHDLKKDLQKAYQNLWDIINKKDTASLLKIISERENLLAVAFYFSAKEKEEAIQDLLSIIKDDTYELAPFSQEAKMYFYGYGKMVTLLDLEREGVIRFVNKKDPKETISLEFRFHRKKTNEELKVI
ncbi:MAG: hypothetical protein REI96_20625 [Flavobacterium nitrogenifigens]|uniref:hypothetical protein n=1 Tax=Flavobacterium nitrogenifigens TaxID=1617283 RepID=UPI0028094F93|nr:hypothetical protein [Flavobacterium nitrogenifigens]MDQ8014865.1 hypothetical protein [Flavobacterium nitrogenifigens]